MKTTQLQDWLTAHNLQISFKERYDPKLPRYYTNVSKCVEITDGYFLIGVYGNGKTKFEALRNYALKLSGKRVRIGDSNHEKYEVDVPKLIVKNLKGI